MHRYTITCGCNRLVDDMKISDGLSNRLVLVPNLRPARGRSDWTQFHMCSMREGMHEECMKESGQTAAASSWD